ncbi:PAS domain-containing protein [Hymenobacter mucosus]|uniref:PAS fold-containing protein n=1 Tax=Hymenobacter mucosus TaxID=1411120 RepID=A0A239BEC9_9BACT|nr:PAS domain-containing protein [Hymenobacter mucosus]SNS06089.1 PAS fold-containing protein [Hymenobacter mucosus]
MPPIIPLSPPALRALESLPDPYLILAPDAAFTILTASTAYLLATNSTRAALQGKPVLEAFPQAPYLVVTNGDNLLASLQQVLHTGQPHTMPLQRYDLLAADGTFVEKYWEMVNWPVFDEQGRIHYLVHKSVDVTAQVLANAQAEDLLEVRDRHLMQLLYQVPAALATVTGPEHRYSFVNARYQALIGNRIALGRCVADAVPELENQGFVELLDSVYQTGKTYYGRETHLTLRDPTTEALRTVSLDFTYQALLDRQGVVTGVLVFAIELPESHTKPTAKPTGENEPMYE